jgi:hypothetical protein
MTKFTYYYGEDTIEASVSALWSCSLHVNGQVQYKKRAWTAPVLLIGKLASGEEIKAEFVGTGRFPPVCILTVNGMLLKENVHYPSERKK